MTEYNTGPDHRDPVQSNQAPATETDSTAPGLETPNFATTDVDPSPDEFQTCFGPHQWRVSS